MFVEARDVSDGSVQWTHREHDGSTVSGVFESDTVVYSVDGSSVIAYDSQSKDVQWTDETSARGVTVYDDVVYVAGSGIEDAIAALDADSGTTRWTVDRDIDANAVAAANGVVYVAGEFFNEATGSVEGWLTAHDADTGDRIWSADGLSTVEGVATARRYVYSGDNANQVHEHGVESADQPDAFVAGSVEGTGSIDRRNVDVIEAHSAIVADDFNPPDGAASAKETTVDLRLTLDVLERPGDPDAAALDVTGTEQTASFTVVNEPGDGDGTMSIFGEAGIEWS